MKKKKWIKFIECDVCRYKNNPDYFQYLEICHCCGKILDERIYFKHEMNKKLRLWKNKLKEW